MKTGYSDELKRLNQHSWHLVRARRVMEIERRVSGSASSDVVKTVLRLDVMVRFGTAVLRGAVVSGV